MSLWSWFSDFCSNHSNDESSNNPANGLSMIGGSGGVDAEGNAYGLDSSHDHSESIGSMGHDDHWAGMSGGGMNDW